MGKDSLKSEFLKVMQERGFIHQCTDLNGLDELILAQDVTAYIGFDCTAPTLHVGSLIQLMVVKWLKELGHNPVILLGGATTRIGDPSGKDEARKTLGQETIEANLAGIKKTIEFIVPGIQIVNNDEWLSNINLLDFAATHGKHFSINRMMAMDSIRNRLNREQHLSFMEFIYMLLQSYDFFNLAATMGCQLQIGGSDQWGNIVTGVKLCEGMMIDRKVFGLTTPLLTNSEGSKMGKTANGAVWLDSGMLPAFDFWQFWRNVNDADVGRFLRLFTTLPLSVIEELETLQGEDINKAKKILATEVTTLVHGYDAAHQAAKTAEETFAKGGIGETLQTFSIPSGPILLRQLIVDAGLAKSNREARDLIMQGGIKLDGETITEVDHIFSFDGEPLKLSKGKKVHIKIVPDNVEKDDTES